MSNLLDKLKNVGNQIVEEKLSKFIDKEEKLISRYEKYRDKSTEIIILERAKVYLKQEFELV